MQIETAVIQNFLLVILFYFELQELEYQQEVIYQKKCQPKFLGPFAVQKILGPVTYQIELPPTMKKAHSVFHVSKLKRFVRHKEDSSSLSVIIDTEGTIEEEVINILDKRRQKRKLYYLVQFEGGSPEEAIWMPKSELKNCQELISKFDRSPRSLTSKQG